MRLVRLALRNIRSYGDEKTVIDFGPGITLFWGDIGSGKSTILAALEFGLFGLGDLSKAHLLRHGERQGEVEVTFAVGAREVKVHRALRRTKRGIDQTDCWLESDGRHADYAPSEMKPAVLSLLNFREKPDPRATSTIYRYAIYTPQEEMKAILLRRAEDRLETLRRAFGIEEYRWAAQNTDEHLLRAWLDREVAIFAAKAEGLGAAREARVEEEHKLADIHLEIAVADARLSACRDRRHTLEKEAAPLTAASEEAARIEGELVGIARECEHETEKFEELRRREVVLTETTSCIPEAEAALAAIQPEYNALQQHTAERRRLAPLREEAHGLEARKAALQQECESARRELESKLARAVASLLEGEAAEERIRALGVEKDEASEAERGLEAALAREVEIDAEIASWSNTRGRLDGERIGISARSIELAAEEEGLAGLDGVAACPRCQQPLNPEHLERLRAEVAADIDRLGKRKASIEEADREILVELEGLEDERRALEGKRHELVEIRRRRAEIAGRVRELEEQARRHEEDAAEVVNIRAALVDSVFGAGLRADLKRVCERLAELASACEAWEDAEHQIAALEEERVVGRYIEAGQTLDRLSEAAQGLGSLRDEIAVSTRRLADLRALALSRAEAKKSAEAVVARLRELEQSIVSIAEEEREVEFTLNGAQLQLVHAEARCEEIERELEALIEYERRRLALTETGRFVRDHFLRAVSEIERQALSHIRGRFDRLFRQWFDRLIESGELEVEIDATFTPLVRLGEYDLDTESLSGGERTSLALPDPLAHNTHVRHEAGMDRESLLILDEPTDGFSSQQMNRLRDILGETGCDQTIIVSHEQELEGVADRVYGVSKERGVSTVAPL